MRFGNHCRRTHSSLGELSDTHQRSLYQFVTDHDNLAFNPQLVPAALLEGIKGTKPATRSD